LLHSLFSLVCMFLKIFSAASFFVLLVWAVASARRHRPTHGYRRAQAIGVPDAEAWAYEEGGRMKHRMRSFRH